MDRRPVISHKCCNLIGRNSLSKALFDLPKDLCNKLNDCTQHLHAASLVFVGPTLDEAPSLILTSSLLASAIRHGTYACGVY